MRQGSPRRGCGRRGCPRSRQRRAEVVDRDLIEVVDDAVQHRLPLVEADALRRHLEAPPVGLEHRLDRGPALHGHARRPGVGALQVDAERDLAQGDEGRAIGVRDAYRAVPAARPAVRAAAAVADGRDLGGAELGQEGSARRARALGQVGGPGEGDAVEPLLALHPVIVARRSPHAVTVAACGSGRGFVMGGLLVLTGGGLQLAAFLQRWARARGTDLIESHEFDYLVPQQPWTPVGIAVEPRGTGLLATALALLVGALSLGGVARLIAAALVGLLGAHALLSGLQGAPSWLETAAVGMASFLAAIALLVLAALQVRAAPLLTLGSAFSCSARPSQGSCSALS